MTTATTQQFLGETLDGWRVEQWMPYSWGDELATFYVLGDRPHGPEWSAALTEPVQVRIQFVQAWDQGDQGFRLERDENGRQYLRAWCDDGPGVPEYLRYGTHSLDITEAVGLGLARVVEDAA